MSRGIHTVEKIGGTSMTRFGTLLDNYPACLLVSPKRLCAEAIIRYVRAMHKADGSELPIGKAPVLRDGTDVVIFAAGIMVQPRKDRASSLMQIQRFSTGPTPSHDL